ncbi:MAG: DnaJ like chaperone protein [Crocinitomicaceae bacterium]|jgi:DnaJ like chaperone protein
MMILPSRDIITLHGFRKRFTGVTFCVVFCFVALSFSSIGEENKQLIEEIVSSSNNPPLSGETNRHNHLVSGYLSALGFFSLLLLILGITLHRHAKIEKQWKSGQIPRNLEFNLDTRLEAYLRLGAMMIRYDKEESGKKIAYIYRFLNDHLESGTSVVRDYPEVMRQAYQHPLKLESAAAWFLKHHYPRHERIQLIYFLAGIAVVDGEMNSTEKGIITKLSELLHLTRKELDSIMSMYAEFEPRERNRRTRSYQSGSKRALEKSSEILGVSTEAGLDEIKKAYRQLVKLHHPDLFATAPIEQQELANERFLKLQNAYEYLEKVK